MTTRRNGQDIPFKPFKGTPQQLAQRRYIKTPLGRGTIRRWNDSEKGMKSRVEWNRRHRAVIKEMQRLGEILWKQSIKTSQDPV